MHTVNLSKPVPRYPACPPEIRDHREVTHGSAMSPLVAVTVWDDYPCGCCSLPATSIDLAGRVLRGATLANQCGPDCTCR